jgi:hypothetical protein
MAPMCIGIEYFLEVERKAVHFDSPEPKLPVRRRDRLLHLGRAQQHLLRRWQRSRMGRQVSRNGLGSARGIRAGEWAHYEPRPVRIFAARFLQVNSWQVPCYFALRPGEFIQGLLAHISPHHKRVYVVTVPLPAEHAGEHWEWPRIVNDRFWNCSLVPSHFISNCH